MTTPAATLPAPDTVLHFWFKEASPKQHFSKDPAFDASIRDRFLTLHAQAAAGELWSWRATPSGRLAEVIVLDQFARNLYRNDPRAFAHAHKRIIDRFGRYPHRNAALGRPSSAEEQAFLQEPGSAF